LLRTQPFLTLFTVQLCGDTRQLWHELDYLDYFVAELLNTLFVVIASVLRVAIQGG
jgi:hypothetical protein